MKDGSCRSDILMMEIACSPAAAAKLLQSCPTLCDPIDGSNIITEN